MKRLVETTGEGLEGLIGESVLVMCSNYFYHGKLVGVNEKDIVISDPHIVYETGSWDEAGFSDSQKLPTKEWLIRTEAIESYGVVE